MLSRGKKGETRERRRGGGGITGSSVAWWAKRRREVNEVEKRGVRRSK